MVRLADILRALENRVSLVTAACSHNRYENLDLEHGRTNSS